MSNSYNNTSDVECNIYARLRDEELMSATAGDCHREGANLENRV